MHRLRSCVSHQDVKKVGGHSSGNCFHQERHQQGTLLLRQGVSEERVMYVVLSGSIQLFRHRGRGLGPGAVDVLATLETGQMFGTFGPELKMPFSAKVVTKNCEVLSARAQLGDLKVWNIGQTNSDNITYQDTHTHI